MALSKLSESSVRTLRESYSGACIAVNGWLPTSSRTVKASFNKPAKIKKIVRQVDSELPYSDKAREAVSAVTMMVIAGTYSAEAGYKMAALYFVLSTYNLIMALLQKESQ